jgi:hypothetical protein
MTMQGWLWLKVKLGKHQDVASGECKSYKHLHFSIGWSVDFSVGADWVGGGFYVSVGTVLGVVCTWKGVTVDFWEASGK